VFKDRAINIPEFFPGKSVDLKKIKNKFSNTSPSFVEVADDNFISKYYKRAWDNLSKAIQLDPNNIEAYFSMIKLNALLSQSNSETDRADKSKVLKLLNTYSSKNYVQQLIIHASILSFMGKKDEVIKETRSILQNYPDNYKVFDLLASAYRSTKQYEKAFDCYNKMMQLSQ
jgi:pentatricopeptide repeat protein